MNDILETMVQVGRQEQHSTEVGLSQFVTVMRPKCRMWTVSYVKWEVFSEVWMKYDVCV
jgi:hypothetical protein